MSKQIRIKGNITPFASNADYGERTVFGTLTVDNDIDEQINEYFRRGWGIVRADAQPTLQDFNAVNYTVTRLIAYLYERGIAEWDVEQDYNIGSICTAGNKIYTSLIDDNVGVDPTIDDGTNWETYTYTIPEINNLLNDKVDKELGKQLSDENYTLAEKQKLASLEPSTTGDIVRKPAPITPLTGDNPDLVFNLSASPFAPMYSVDVRDVRVFEVALATDADFATPVFTSSVDADLVEVSPALDSEVEYIWRCKDVTANGDESAWSDVQTFEPITTYFIVKPSVTAPVDGAIDQPEQPVIQISAFTVEGGVDTQTGTSVEVKDSLGDVVWSQDNITPLNNIPVAAGVLVENETYTVRVRYHGTAIADSPWSDWSVFTTATDFIIDTPGAAFGGGYVAGKIKVGSSTYLLIVSGGGGDSFQVDDSKHSWKTANTADATVDGTAPASMNDGLANFNYMKAQGLVNYPAAKWVEDTCNAGAGLSGKKDWYPPSRDEEEIVYRTFKPDATANSVTAQPATGFGGDGLGQGTNANSVPAGSAYTSGDPAQTVHESFKTGGVNAMEAGLYWSSSEGDATAAWLQRMSNGFQNNGVKTNAYRVRAVRRILIS